MKKKIKILVISFLPVFSFAQKSGELGEEQVVITKDKKIEFPAANRIFEKIPALSNKPQEKQLKYSFSDYAPKGVVETVFNPTAMELPKKDIEDFSYSNYLRAGFGNFGRIYGEGYLHSKQDLPMNLGLHVKHNSTNRGPVDDKNSALMDDHANLYGKFMTEKFKVSGDVQYDRNQFYFYGYKPRTEIPERENIKQVINKVQFGLGFENITPNPRVDYELKTRIRTLKNFTDASETDWETNFNAFFPITEKFTAILNTDAYMTQRVDSTNINERRNLFRVKPSFKYNSDLLTITVGLKAVNEFEEVKQTNRTRGFPVVDITYKNPSGISYFAGYDGDFVRHTFGLFLQENQFLADQVVLRNTEKSREIYAGIKGEMPSKLSYNLKTSYNEFKNLHFFNNWKADTSKFEMLYDSTKVKTWHLGMQLNYQPTGIWRTTLNTNYYRYGVNQFEKAYHRPSVVVSWGNTLVFSEKLLINTQAYFIGATYSKSPVSNQLIKNKSIIDLNSEIDYLFLKNLSVFVRINNLLGKKYQRYTNYQQQGLNFLVGMNFSF